MRITHQQQSVTRRRLAGLAAITVLVVVLCFSAPAVGQKGKGGGGGGGTNPPPSPDIAYVDGSNLRVMAQDGSGQVTVTSHSGVRRPVWSPDNSELAYWGGDGIYRVRLDGTGKTRIVPRIGLLHNYPDWSAQPAPDGLHKIAFNGGFSSNPDGYDDVYIVNPDGSGLQNLTDSDFVDEWWVCWLADGRIATIRFSEAEWTDSLVILTLGLVDGQVAVVDEWIVSENAPHRRIAGANTSISIFSDMFVSQRSRVFLTESFDNPVMVTAGSTGDEAAGNFSPDDTRLVFRRGGNKGGIFTVNLDGSNEVKISSRGIDPRWRR